MRSWLLSLGLLAVAGMFFTQLGADDKAKMGSPAVGKPAPAFTLEDQAGKSVSLADFKGKVVVLEWFNEGCPFVVKFYKGGHMNQWAQKYAAQDVVWLAINSTSGKDNAANAKIAQEWQISRPILNDSAGNVGHAYRATNTPQMFVINKEGNIAYMGAIDSMSTADQSDIEKATNYVAKALDAVLANQTVAESETKPYGCSVKYGKKG